MKLLSLLKESLNVSKAIFVVGPAGSGKSTIINKLIPNLSQFKIINVDDFYEKILKDQGVNLDQTKWSPEERSIGGKAMGQAKKKKNEFQNKLISKKQNIIIDATGGASKSIIKLNSELKDLGYKTLMVGLYVPPLVSLKRNMKRERRLISSIILRTWASYVKNIETYKNEFKDNFLLLNNSNEDAEELTPEKLDKYIDKNLSTKPKTDKEKEKSKKSKEKLHQELFKLNKLNHDFNTFDEVKQKVNNFI